MAEVYHSHVPPSHCHHYRSCALNSTLCIIIPHAPTWLVVNFPYEGNILTGISGKPAHDILVFVSKWAIYVIKNIEPRITSHKRPRKDFLVKMRIYISQEKRP